MNRYCLTLDLKDDPALIREYEEHHNSVWPEIVQSIKGSGIKAMEIYRVGTRLFMLVEADEGFSFEKKGKLDSDNLKVQEWETLMWKYQQPLPAAKSGEKWMQMHKIFELK